jgi:hypothetical protein
MMKRIQYRTLLKECQEKFFKEGEPVTAQDLGMYSLIKPQVKVGYWWGNWKLGSPDALFCYDPEDKFDNPIYWIDLLKLSGSATVLDKIYDVVDQQWANVDIIANLIWALEDIFDPRRNICNGGIDQNFSAATYLENLKDNNN